MFLVVHYIWLMMIIAGVKKLLTSFVIPLLLSIICLYNTLIYSSLMADLYFINAAALLTTSAHIKLKKKIIKESNFLYYLHLILYIGRFNDVELNKYVYMCVCVCLCVCVCVFAFACVCVCVCKLAVILYILISFIYLLLSNNKHYRKHIFFIT